MRKGRFSVPVIGQLVVVLPFAAALLCIPTPGFASPILTADLASFAVLAASTVTSDYPTNPSTIFGNVGVSAGSGMTGFGVNFPGTSHADTTLQVTGGFIHETTVLAADAQSDLDDAITALIGFGPGLSIGADLTGTIFPGVYTLPTGGINLPTGNALTLNGLGSNSAVWLFNFPSTLIANEDSTVTVTNIGDGANVGIYWLVGSAATLNGDTFAGNVITQTELISSNGGLVMGCGRLLSATKAVTLIGDTISIGCAGFAAPNPGFGGGDTEFPPLPGPGGPQVPEPATLILLATGLVGAAGSRWKRRRIASGRP